LNQIGGQELSWQSTQHAAAISFTDAAAICEFDVAAGTRSLLLCFRWLEPNTHGTYIQLDLEQLDAQGLPLASFAAIVGPGSDPTTAVYSLFHVHQGARRARLKWRNAWDDGTIAIDAVGFTAFADHLPAGSVGLTAANMDQSGELLSDVLLHIEHYRHRSAEFAPRCAEYFNADRIIERLLAQESASPSLPHSLAQRRDLAPQADPQPNAS
jgi:hypothetical protein